MSAEGAFLLDPDAWREHGGAVVNAVDGVVTATSGAHFDEPIQGLLVNSARAAWDEFARSHQSTHHALLGHTASNGHALIGSANEIQNHDEDAGSGIAQVSFNL